MYQTRKVHLWMRRHRANRDSEHAINFAKGVLIGGIIVLIVGLMVA